MNIKKISAQQTYHLRQKILRPNHGIEVCKFPQDHDDSTAHFGAFDSDEIVGIVSLFNVPFVDPESPVINKIQDHNSSENDWQIRAMATDDAVRRMGFAAVLLKSAEQYTQSQDGVLIWCNARTAAVGFYKKQDYRVIGDEFEIEGVGPHFRMKKAL